MYRQYRDTKVHDYSFVKMGHGIMLICSYQEDNIPEDYQNMLHHINDILVEAGFLPESYHIGICDEILPLDRLNEAIIKSKMQISSDSFSSRRIQRILRSEFTNMLCRL